RADADAAEDPVIRRAEAAVETEPGGGEQRGIADRDVRAEQRLDVGLVLVAERILRGDGHRQRCVEPDRRTALVAEPHARAEPREDLVVDHEVEELGLMAY